ncbi:MULTISPECIES: competence protein ComK [Staphylococcus]|uniref:Competence protein ComK n=1 Tax=Staphylococcus hsinchuensis TaxID=3051183 RepID=A0ABZ3EDA4_9STAP|nr:MULTISPECIES: competence protein ComK [unclassified Staphylococcus]
MSQLTKILYFKTVLSYEPLTLCQFTTHQFTYPTTITRTLKYFLETYQLSFDLQCKKAKQLLKIRKLVPLVVSKDIILFPVKTQRAPLQYYINAAAITGITSKGNQTYIFFENTTYIILDVPYTLVYKKWQESLTLSHLLT